MQNNTHALVQISKLNAALAEARSFLDFVDISDKSKAAQILLSAAGLGEHAKEAKIIQLRAERLAGDFLRDTPKAKPGPKELGDTMSPNSKQATYREAGITKKQASRWQQIATLPDDEFEKIIEASRKSNAELTQAKFLKAARARKTEQARAELVKEYGETKSKGENWNIYHDDISFWNASRRYDFIITDPPYPKEYLDLYEVLAKRAREWLVDGGLLVAMCGQSYLDVIYRLMNKHLDYYWTAAYLLPGQPTPLRHKQVNTTWKPLLMFTKKGDQYNGKVFGDVFVSDANDKSMHKWGQSESGMYSIIKQVCLPGQSILDPFCGAGTTGVAALKHNCLFDGVEILENNVKISRVRLNSDAQ